MKTFYETAPLAMIDGGRFGHFSAEIRTVGTMAGISEISQGVGCPFFSRAWMKDAGDRLSNFKILPASQQNRAGYVIFKRVASGGEFTKNDFETIRALDLGTGQIVNLEHNLPA